MPMQPVRSVVVTAPSRLHFGMFSFGRSDVRQFGGVGAMIESPGVRVSIRPDVGFAVTGAHAQRARRFAEQIVRNLHAETGLPLELDELRMVLDVTQAPREHVGLGVGTQLGLSVAAAICAALGLPPRLADELARLAGRGARSAIGTHGFEQGGLLLEAGKYAGDKVSPLIARLELPREWRFQLIVPRRESGMAGIDETAAFSRLPAVPLSTTDQLVREATMHLLPAAVTGDFLAFSKSLYRFGHLAGTCFATEQGGAFASQRTTKIVERLQAIGVEGVGQSSWGPTVFALCESEHAAEDLLRQVRASAEAEDYDCLISAPANQGAAIEILHDE